ncbi:MAG: glycogen debranching protein GlgX [Bryobacterales bacterium]|nr:glycogen debranching protein GlgX [Bryobacterales bacterium]
MSSTEAFAIRRGSPLPLGATPRRGGVNFAIFSQHATWAALVLFRPGEEEPFLEQQLDPLTNRTGFIWHAFVEELNPGYQYGFRFDRQPNDDPRQHRYDPSRVLFDPYAKALSGGFEWGTRGPGVIAKRRSIILNDPFDWQDDQPLNYPLADSIIYELHVRGFTRHESSGAAQPGTFLGLIEKIPYLKDLGITAVELLPVYEFEEADTDRVNPFTGEPLLNFWGYHPMGFFSPNACYCSSGHDGDQVREFKEMVRAFHKAGIEVILDVVFNHTSEGDERGETFCYRGVDNAVYYMLDRPGGRYLNFSGCGNTLNCNHPQVRDLIRDCVRYWVTEMHVDGFRFDLASILGRDQDGSVLTNPPLLEMLAHDPVLAHTKLIAEAWDAAGLYQVGTFPAWGRWAEWNGQFRDDVRRWVKGDGGMAPRLATRLLGSPDLYQTSARQPYHSINFVTCHDGFTLNDLVSYNQKHNWANGEDNRDGADDNHSWNCGWEGPTASREVLFLRRRQMKNLAAILLMSHGVPMILGGDEMGRTQFGNNNAYCQDNEVSWVDWAMADSNADLGRFFRLMIAFRKQHALLRRTEFDAASGPRIEWHGVRHNEPDWSHHCRTIALHLYDPMPGSPEDQIYFISNTHWEPHTFELPAVAGLRWRRFADTTLASPHDIREPGDEPVLTPQSFYTAGPRSVVILVGRMQGDPVERVHQEQP